MSREIFFLALAAIVAEKVAGAAISKHIIMISIDGFRWDYVDKYTQQVFHLNVVLAVLH